MVIGAGGKSGLLCLHEAKKRAGVTGKVIGMGHSDSSCERIKELGLADLIIQGDAKKPVETLEMLKEKTDGELADIVINNVNINDTEMASVLCTKDKGTIYFFSMATSFTKAALGAEGVGKDVNMIIGNGYTEGHAEISLEILRENKKLRKIFERLYT
jgi:L-erythro-3,5-diaminohexanoate dehydrogenase